MTKQERLKKINELLVVIASNGRKFLLNQKDGEVSKFVIKANNHVYYRDYYTKQELKGTKAMYKRQKLRFQRWGHVAGACNGFCGVDSYRRLHKWQKWLWWSILSALGI